MWGATLAFVPQPRRCPVNPASGWSRLCRLTGGHGGGCGVNPGGSLGSQGIADGRKRESQSQGQEDGSQVQPTEGKIPARPGSSLCLFPIDSPAKKCVASSGSFTPPLPFDGILTLVRSNESHPFSRQLAQAKYQKDLAKVVSKYDAVRESAKAAEAAHEEEVGVLRASLDGLEASSSAAAAEAEQSITALTRERDRLAASLEQVCR